MSDKSRAPRKVAIADHLWDAFEQMAQEMGSDREGLINQAMFMFARLNGFLTPGGGEAVAAPVVAKAPRAKASDSEGDDDDGREARRREVEERVLETAAKLERDIKGKGKPEPEPDPTPEPDFDAAVDEDEGEFDEDEDFIDDEEIDDDEIVDELMGEVSRKNLYLMSEDGELDKIVKERFLIGRGKHCDFIIQSGKVSREHAVIVREDDGFFIEDLGSSNGTWHNKKRIKRRKVEDGDEYYVCSEKVKMVIR